MSGNHVSTVPALQLLNGFAMASSRATPSGATARQQGHFSGSDLDSEPRHESTRSVLTRFVELLYVRRKVRTAFECCVAANGYRDHGDGSRLQRGGRASVMTAMLANLANTKVRFEVLHLLVEGNQGMVHVRCHRADGEPSTDHVEIYRIDQGRIVERWTVAGDPSHTQPPAGSMAPATVVLPAPRSNVAPGTHSSTTESD